MTVDASLTDVARAIAGTDVSQTLYQTLRTVRGVAPIVQTIHILSVTAHSVAGVGACAGGDARIRRHPDS